MRRRDFTLVELLVVMVIIAVLSGLVIGGAGLAQRKMAEAKTISLMQQLEVGLEKFRSDRGYYPHPPPDPAGAPTLEEFSLDASLKEDKNTETGRPYLENYTGGMYKDAWGEPFWYRYPGKMNPGSYDLWSKGRDRKHGDGKSSPDDALTANADDSDDISNWKQN